MIGEHFHSSGERHGRAQHVSSVAGVLSPASALKQQKNSNTHLSNISGMSSNQFFRGKMSTSEDVE